METGNEESLISLNLGHLFLTHWFNYLLALFALSFTFFPVTVILFYFMNILHWMFIIPWGSLINIAGNKMRFVIGIFCYLFFEIWDWGDYKVICKKKLSLTWEIFSLLDINYIIFIENCILCIIFLSLVKIKVVII